MSHRGSARGRRSRAKTTSPKTGGFDCDCDCDGDGDGEEVQLFAFDASGGSGGSRANNANNKRKIKTVARFDPSGDHSNNNGTSSSSSSRISVRVGEGFACPRCGAAVGYADRSCDVGAGGCGLECCYEAGVGVVILNERPAGSSGRNLSQRARRRNEGGNEGGNAAAAEQQPKRRRRGDRRSEGGENYSDHRPPPVENALLPRGGDDDDNERSGGEEQREASSCRVVGDNIAIGNEGGHEGKEEEEEEEEDPPLPEELRGLDRTLIERIENEIGDVSSGRERVTLDDIAGLEDAKDAVRHMAIYPLERPDLFTGRREPGRGLLLFGPPGTGKTLIGKAIANESRSTFFSIKCSTLAVVAGRGDEMVRTLFAVAHHRAPSVIFFDEVDAVMSSRESDGRGDEAGRRAKAELLVQLDGVGNERERAGPGGDRVLFVGATNLPWRLDAAARRRFEEKLYAPLPSQRAREALLRNILGKGDVRHRLTDGEIAKLSHVTHGHSGDDLRLLCKRAARRAMRRILGEGGVVMGAATAGDIPPVSYGHFLDALGRAGPSVSREELAPYEEWNDAHSDGGGYGSECSSSKE